jgi:hypothetical protein
VVIAGAAVVLVALSVALLFLIRVVRRRRARDVRSAAVVRYVEFLSWCRGAGLGRGPGETPVEHAARLGAETTSAVEPLGRLVSLVDDALWAEGANVDPDEVARFAAKARSALRSTLSRRTRWLAAAGWGRWRIAV